MKPSSIKFNNNGQGVHFTAAKAPNVDDLRAARRFANCALNGYERKLIKSIKRKAPQLVKNIEGEDFIPSDSITQRAVSSVKSFFGLPLDVLNAAAAKFPDSALYNSKLLRRHRAASRLEEKVRAVQGIQSHATDYVKRHIEDGNYPTGPCNPQCRKVCTPISQEFLKSLNESMADSVANYDTKKERFATRLVSGFTAAMFLGNDFYNNAIKKGKTQDEAKKAQHLKQGQEIKENICEGITQFAVFSCFSKLVNSNVWAPAILGAGIGLVSRVISRLSSGMPIFRVKVPPKAVIPTMNEYTVFAKNNCINEMIDEKTKSEKEAAQQKKKKGAVLSKRNIILMCLGSIAAGYSLRFLKGHTDIGKLIADKLQAHKDKFDEKTIETVTADRATLEEMVKVIGGGKQRKLAKAIESYMGEMPADAKKIELGTRYKTRKLFGKVEVKDKDLYALRTAPFRFVKELVSYPYKIVSKLESAIKATREKSKNADKVANTVKSLKVEGTEENGIIDKYNIKNVYLKYTEFKEKYGDDDRKLAKEFNNYIRKMILLSNNEVSSSKGDNSKIAVIAQTLGTLTGMWFSMNDEFNAAVKNGSTKDEAEKEARLRGINKFFRMTVQIIISGSLNNVFAKQYNSSVAKSALIVAASTALTDAASRVLTGMPTKKTATKEEFEAYQKHHKEGFMAGYYRLIDKLAS